MRLPILVVTAALLAGCSDQPAVQDSSPSEIVLLTHDSFAASKSVLRKFTERTGIDVKVVTAGDAGALTTSTVLSAGSPQADVVFGIDNTFLSRAQEGGVFDPYQSPGVPADLSEPGGVTPIDTGAVCVNFDREYFADRDPPTSLDDLTSPEYAGLTVVQDPATSSPGLAFLLATIETRPDDWQQYWRDLKANDVLVVDSWEAAYYQHFSGGSGEGDRPIVVSYSTSPAAEPVFAAEPGARATTGYVDDGCFEQVEYAGVLAGTRQPAAARQFVDFLLDRPFQQDIPLQMFVYPVNPRATLPAEFVKYAPPPTSTVSMTPEEIAAGRQEWIAQWSEIMDR